ncbi:MULTISPECIES: HAD hydrolase-like protein [unclassified Lactobacillus]|uniref:HAD hydrolase-like protein n=1 Tax=unclassified Lactobacillus TaxID=2620435 RepID=UPI000EFBB289|nr:MULTISPECIES: HAD hydrolase-like protein [unclassified Lactobacillus]RMC38434.1 HAD family hydrolase [Lactobacillus sp. ESL0237]RMC43242.1 HAD family hydrolase [Lactobacillus sp. ESL0234]RMC44269.1 HAD family hydrolase [Lactobacillus sp. ESL0236]RMC49237.1 HAD family hydrolase [Lactobacillus sp. ESL0225]
MTKFETLIFIPEGSLLNEQVAERKALSQTLKSKQPFGPSERLKYTKLQEKTKLLGLNKRISLILNAFNLQPEIFTINLQKQHQLVKGTISFLDAVVDQVNLIMLAKESKQIITPRLEQSALLTYFAATYFADDFTQELPAKSVLAQVVRQEQLDPDTCLVIGTDLADEIQGAVNTNLQSLWLAPKKSKLPISPRPTLHLNKLSDLLFYLDLS